MGDSESEQAWHIITQSPKTATNNKNVLPSVRRLATELDDLVTIPGVDLHLNFMEPTRD